MDNKDILKMSLDDIVFMGRNKSYGGYYLRQIYGKHVKRGAIIGAALFLLLMAYPLIADKLKGNYLLIHGTTDDNVHFQNSIEMANALIAANKQYDTYFYPNRNHGINSGNARLHLFNKMTNYILEKL